MNDLQVELMKAEFAKFRAEIRADFAELRLDLLKWMFFLWVLNAIVMVVFNPFAGR